MEKAKRAKLMEEMSNRTLVGEYCGDQNHQHLIRYESIAIYFYAVVDNANPDICWSCEKALALFKHFDLDSVNIKSHGIVSDYD